MFTNRGAGELEMNDRPRLDGAPNRQPDEVSRRRDQVFRRPCLPRVSWSSRFSLLSRFALISLVLLGALGVVLGQRLQQSQQDRTLDDAVRSAEIAANVGVKPFLAPADLSLDFVPIDVERLGILDRSLGSSLSRNGIARVKIWNRQHWIVYSDNTGLVGRWFAGDRGIEDAFDGRTSSEITDLSGPEELEERNFGQMLAVYVPLRLGADGQFSSNADDEIVGAFEIYLPYEPIAAAIGSDTRRLYLTIAAGLAVLYLALFRIVAGASRRLRRQADDNAHQATHDQITGLPNRRLLAETGERRLRDLPSDEHLVLALLDLDRFKEINDTLGHRSGDVVLRVIGGRLRCGLSDETVVARLGGDEFAVLAPIAAVADPADLARRIEAILEHPVEVDGIEIAVRASIGLAVAPEDGFDVETLLQRADVAMYSAKRTHSRHRRYVGELDTYSPERLHLAAEVRRAIANDEFFLAYQPKVAFADGSVHGLEALVRWQHPHRGVVSPGEFLPVIENTELIGPLTYHLLELALEQWGVWRKVGLDLPIAVNLSARSVLDPDLPERVSDALRRHHAPSSALELELTESAVLADPEDAAVALRRLSALGIRIAVDDFGTGYASLAYLMALPVDVVKIDMSFAQMVTTDPTAAAVVGFTVDLARHLELEVVAEGVEDIETFDELSRLGCDLAQGYFICRPLPAAEITEWLRSVLPTDRTPSPMVQA